MLVATDLRPLLLAYKCLFPIITILRTDTQLARFGIVFLNCYNLDAVGSNRGPKSEQALTNKISNLATTLESSTDGSPPAIVCLCEIGSETLGKQLAETISPDFYQTLWTGGSNSPQPGLMICYNPEVLYFNAEGDDRRDDGVEQNRNIGSRRKWYAVRFKMKSGSQGLFWLILNHWKSQMGGETQTEDQRNVSAFEIGDFFLGTARTTTDAVVLIGDFNCEPGAFPFRKPNNSLRVVRERAFVLRDRNRLAYFYNPMWRLLGEADALDITRRDNYSAPRPPGTIHIEGQGWRTFDQIMVSKRMLTGGLIRFIESSVRIVEPDAGCSDHCSLSAEFEY